MSRHLNCYRLRINALVQAIVCPAAYRRDLGVPVSLMDAEVSAGAEGITIIALLSRLYDAIAARRELARDALLVVPSVALLSLLDHAIATLWDLPRDVSIHEFEHYKAVTVRVSIRLVAALNPCARPHHDIAHEPPNPRVNVIRVPAEVHAVDRDKLRSGVLPRAGLPIAFDRCDPRGSYRLYAGLICSQVSPAPYTGVSCLHRDHVVERLAA